MSDVEQLVTAPQVIDAAGSLVLLADAYARLMSIERSAVIHSALAMVEGHVLADAP